jgi:phasin family protein
MSDRKATPSKGRGRVNPHDLAEPKVASSASHRFDDVPPAAVVEPVAATIAVAASTTIETLTSETQTMTNTVFNADAVGQKAGALFNEFNDRAKTALEKGSKVAENFADLTKGNLEALTASGRVAAKGAETLAQGAAEFGRKNFEEATRALKGFAAAKSPTEFFQLQNEFAKSQFDAFVAETSRVSETVVKLWGDVVEPISSRAAVAGEKVRAAIN